MKQRVLLSLVIFPLLLAGCALPGPATGGGSDRNTITAEAIARVGAQTAYEAVERLQPQWLAARGNASLTDSSAPVPSVFVNGIEVGDMEYLRNVLALDVEQMRYYPPGEAGARFGMGHPRGVVEVTLR